MSEGECLGIQSQNCRGILIEGRGRERTEQGVVATLTEWHACLPAQKGIQLDRHIGSRVANTVGRLRG